MLILEKTERSAFSKNACWGTSPIPLNVPGGDELRVPLFYTKLLPIIMYFDRFRKMGIGRFFRISRAFYAFSKDSAVPTVVIF